MATTVPFRSPIQIALFLPFQNRDVIFTTETVAQPNGTVIAKQTLNNFSEMWYKNVRQSVQIYRADVLCSNSGGLVQACLGLKVLLLFAILVCNGVGDSGDVEVFLGLWTVLITDPRLIHIAWRL